jgi:RimJ/RimL family protein N-acetyltransferase
MEPLLLDFPTEFSSDRLLLRSYQPGDGAMYFRMVRANWDHLYEFFPPSVMALQSEEDAEVLIRKLVAEWRLRNLLIFGVWEKSTGAYVGETYLANADWSVPRIEVGYFVVQEQTRKGYATEAARAAICFAFEHLQVVRVELRCNADNTASRRVAEHCGFVYEGRFRDHHRKKSGELVDTLWYSILRSDWQHLQ